MNNFNVVDQNTIDIDYEALFISGLIISDNVEQIDVAYLMVNNIPSAKYDNFHFVDQANNNASTPNNELEWNFAILKNYLPDGCKQITVAGMKNNLPFLLDDYIEICV